MDAEDLLEIKKEVVKRKDLLQQLKGKEQILLERLGIQYGCRTIKKAVAELTRLSKNAEKLKKVMAEEEQRIREEYEI
jgi:hypothetical protein